MSSNTCKQELNEKLSPQRVWREEERGIGKNDAF